MKTQTRATASNPTLHYNYDLQVWVKNGIIQDCNHPRSEFDAICCTAHELAGFPIVFEAVQS